MSEPEKHESQPRSIYMENRIWDQLETIAKANDRSISAEIRRALRVYVLDQQQTEEAAA